jgi:hypothetical protein
MTEKELWNYFLDKQVHLSKPLRRKLVWIKSEDFYMVKSYFIQDFNILHPDRSFRSYGYFWHIHCIEQGEYVQVHRDTGNLAQFFPLGIIHFFFDVVPYVLLAWFKRVSFLSLFTHPHRLK